MTKSFHTIILFLICPILLWSNGEQRLSKKNIVGIFKAENNCLLLNDKSGNLFKYNGETVEKIEIRNDVSNPTVNILFVNSEFKLVSDWENSIYRIDNKGNKNELLSVVPDERILSASYDHTNYYISTDDGLYIIDEVSNNNTKLFEGDIDSIQSLICGSDECYIALNNLVIVPGKQNNVLAELPDRVLDLDYHPKQGLLILTTSGVYLMDDGRAKQLHPATGSLSNDIVAIQSDTRWLYIIGNQEVQVFDWQNSELIHLGNYSGAYSTTCIDFWSNLWLASTEGVWNFSSNNNFDGPYFYGLDITDTNGKAIDLDAFEFTEEKQLLNVEAKLSYLPNHEDIQTEWKTKEGDWRVFKKDFVLSNEFLKKGKNKISLRAKASNSEYTLPYTFEISNKTNSDKIPSFWYLIFAVLAGLMLMGLISLFNLKGKQNEAELQLKKLRAENELLQSQQQIDQLKMNPHFIFNALTSINGLVASGNTSEGRKAISQFSKFLRQFLNQSQNESISIEDEIALLKNYVNIELLCRNHSFDFSIKEVDEDLFDVNIPNMIIQPFIENSIIHAFGNLNRKGNITLEFEESEGYLIGIIKDNGVGLNNTKKKESEHKSVAINLVKQRLSQRDKKARKSYVEYSDNSPGTIVKVYLRRL